LVVNASVILVLQSKLVIVSAQFGLDIIAEIGHVNTTSRQCLKKAYGAREI